MSISVEVNIEPTLKSLSIFSDGIAHPAKINRQIAIQLYGWVVKNFQSGGAMQTPPWAPLAPSTLKQKQRLGYSSQPLMRTGHLRQSFAPFSDDSQAGVGAQASAGVDYAEVHETGSLKRPGRPPARPMLPPVAYARDTAVQIYTLEIDRLRQQADL